VKDVAARQPLRHRKCVFLDHPFCRRVHFLSADDAHVVDGKLFSHCVWQQVQRPHCPPGLNKVIDPFDKRRKGGTEVANNVQREAVKVAFLGLLRVSSSHFFMGSLWQFCFSTG